MTTISKIRYSRRSILKIGRSGIGGDGVACTDGLGTRKQKYHFAPIWYWGVQP